VLGLARAIIQPAMMMVVFSIFLGRGAKMPSEGLPYPVSSNAGLLPWTFYSTAISGSAASLVGSSNEGFRSVFLGRPFDWIPIGVPLSVSILVFAVGVVYFEKVERRFADII
jgi:lipopolysaccharide transport system permease protein